MVAIPQPGSFELIDDPIALTQALVHMDSSNPSIGATSGAGECTIARCIQSWLAHRQIEVHRIEPTVGRPSIVGVVRGSGGGKSLMFNGHLDTVSLSSYLDDPLSGRISEDRIYGRGSADMKSGVAAAMIALAKAKDLDLKGDVIFTGVSDEEGDSIGTAQVLQAGWTADAAIVSEPTNLELLTSHKGIVILEVNIYGIAAHGSHPDLGVDAIAHAGYFLVELDRFLKELQQSPGHPNIGPGSIHASIITGGQEVNSFPAQCTIQLDRRTIPGETPESVEQEVRGLLQKAAENVPHLNFDVKITLSQPAFHISSEHPFIALTRQVIEQKIGHPPTLSGAPYWTDCGLLSAHGIPSLLWGPSGGGLHAEEEWVDIHSITHVTEALTEIARQYCA
ncbi:hypothetical protein CNMCM5878_003943 [Aspergillus fumigatiaffinis]|nr:hypothetical protein CNMCM5878_003943 [Aspergillus fumigatiaffinis]